MLNIPVLVPQQSESTSLGVAFLAGLHTGIWKSGADLRALQTVECTYTPAMEAETREQLLMGWQKALRQTLTV